MGGGDHRNNAFMTYTGVASLTKIVGKHTVKMGTDLRLMRVNVFEARSSCDYTLSRSMTQGPNPTQSSSSAGNGFASLLLGTGTGGTLQANYKNVATQSFYVAGYIQDEWRVTPTLSLSLGLRWDVDMPRTERYNRTNYFDPQIATPAAQAVPGIKGGLVFVGVNGMDRHQFLPDYNNWAPRFGLSWQAAPKT
ncbi:MAG TPA: TonB-dependent receptor, partial [Anaerolineae bacterium]